MKFQVYFLLGTSLSCLPGLAFGQCIPVQDCTALGYTASSCDGGKGVKCPFGNGWFCSGDESSICAENGFKYSCIGTGYAGGAGSACGGKYTQCSCASGYEWKNGSCQKQILNGAQGDLYYCNGKVVGVKTGDMNFYVAMQDLGYMNWNPADISCRNYIFCGNLKGTFPMKEQLVIMYNNKSSLEALLISNAGKKFSTDDSYWSASTDSNNYHYTVDMSNGNGNWYYDDDNIDFYVRPVLVTY